MKKLLVLSAFGALAPLAFLPSASADILTFNNGAVMRGVMDKDGSDATHVKFTSAEGSTKIPRARIKSIEGEPEAQGYLHIGDDLRKAEKLDQAMEFYQKAAALDPASPAPKDRIKSIQDTIESRKKMTRQDDVKRIDELTAQISRAIRDNDFKSAEELLKTSSDLRPNPEQKTKLQKLVGDFYLAWARERMDKLDSPGAEEKLNLALAAQPDNDVVIDMLLKLWEGQPTKADQTLRIYETVLERKGEDPILRRKVADLYFDKNNYEEAIVHYLKLYKGNEAQYKGTPLEARIAENLDLLHRQAARGGDFKQAIYFFKLYESIAADADPSIQSFYEYMQKLGETPPNKPENMIALAVFAEERGLDTQALEHYRNAAAADKENKAAFDGINRYALKRVGEAQKFFGAQDYYLAKGFAQQVLDEYRDSEEAVLRAREIIGKADTEIARDQREKRDMAKQYVERGDTYYNQALVFYRDIFNTEVQGTTLLSTPKADATRHFQYAIAAYETAIRIDPSLASDAGSLVGPNLAECKKYLARLTAPPPRTGFSQSRRPMR